jgi:sterol desaturase/sphingolipid hydroxylase (fatty acid hydroxylase superfamily)
MIRIGWAKRKFDPSRTITLSRLIHNVFYSICGALVGSLYECMFMHLWATGKLPYISNQELLTSPIAILRVLFWTIMIPNFREIHFYTAHKFIHFRALYKFIHSLHHRNTDIEPFSGLSMHPAEHIYYISSIAPSLIFLMSPFHVVWNLQHLLISPAASHSGWEDHWQRYL